MSLLRRPAAIVSTAATTSRPRRSRFDMGCASGAGIIVPHAGCQVPGVPRCQSAKCECVTSSCVTRNQCRRKCLMRVQRLLFVTGSAWVVSGVAVVMLAARTARAAARRRSSAAERYRTRTRRRSAAQSQRRGDRSGPQEHDGAARHQGAASRAERQRVGAQPRQLRRGAGQSVPEPARRR